MINLNTHDVSTIGQAEWGDEDNPIGALATLAPLGLAADRDGKVYVSPRFNAHYGDQTTQHG